MAKKATIPPGHFTGTNSTDVNDSRDLDRLINSVSLTGSGIELLRLRSRILFYLKKMQDSQSTQGVM